MQKASNANSSLPAPREDHRLATHVPRTASRRRRFRDRDARGEVRPRECRWLCRSFDLHGTRKRVPGRPWPRDAQATDGSTASLAEDSVNREYFRHRFDPSRRRAKDFAPRCVSFIGNTSRRPSPRSRMTVAVHGPMPLIPQRSAAASGLACSSSIASSSAPAASASATRRSVESLPGLRPAARKRSSSAREKASAVGNV